MKVSKILLSAALGVGMAFCALAVKQDGTWIKPLSSAENYNSTCYWQYNKMAQDGGKLTFINQGSAYVRTLTVNPSGGVTLGGIDFGAAYFTLAGNAIKLTGTGELRSDDLASVVINNEVSLLAGATMSQRGCATLTYNNTVALADDATYSLEGGKLVSKASDGFFTAGTLELKSGIYLWQPQVSSGTALTVNAGALKYGPDRAHIKVEKGNAASYAVTFASLTRTGGGFLDLQLTGDISALGETEKFLVKGRASDDGTYVDASVISRGAGTAGDQIHFLKYDANKGFVPAETKDFVSGASELDGKVAVIGADTTINANTTVSALMVTNGASVTIASGVTLAVGDGKHPAGVIWRVLNQPKGSNKEVTPIQWYGPGTLQFAAGAPGYFYQNGNVAAADQVSWTQESRFVFSCDSGKVIQVAGDKGVTLAGAANDFRDYGSISVRWDNMKWTGGTTIAGVRLQSGNSMLSSVPGPVGVYGDRVAAFGAQIRQNSTLSPTQAFTLSGTGSKFWDGSHAGIIDWGGSPHVTFKEKITLANDIMFRNDNNAGSDVASVIAEGGITGPYGIRMYTYGSLDLAGPCDYTGKTVMKASCAHLYISGPNGTPGAGPVISEDNATLRVKFRNLDGLITSNDFKSIGPIVFEQVTNIAFKGSVSFASATFADGQVTACGTNGVNFGSYAASRNMAFSAAVNGGSLQIGKKNTDLTLGATYRDGANGEKFGLDKVTGDTITLNGAALTHSGPTRVLEGTLKLKDDIFTSPDILYWMDAADESTFETNASGRVTCWNSKQGVSGLAFATAENGNTVYAGPTATNTINGKRVLTFSQSDVTRLVLTNTATKTALPVVDQRTVFMVALPRVSNMTISNCGLFGAYLQDRGQRVGSSGWDVRGYNGSPEASKTGATFDTTVGLRLDGSQHANDPNAAYYQYKNGESQIVTMRHELDYSIISEGATYSSIGRFTPAIGGYHAASNRTFDGDIGEVIAFSRLLTTNEMELVENYLAEKWGIAAAHHDTITPQVNSLLSPNSPLEIAKGAVLDLNGISVTVAALSGAGTITNSSVTAATITVKGVNAFAGMITGAVTIRVEGANDPAAGYALENGATLEVASGLTLGYNGDLPVTNGIAYWLDASHTETVFTNSTGHVTNWNCRIGNGVTRFEASGDWCDFMYTAPERYDLTGFDGKPGVYFGNTNPENNTGSNQLASVGTAATKTLFLCCKCDETCASTAGFWGARYSERGVIMDSNLTKSSTTFSLRFYTGTCYHKYGYLLHALGADKYADYTWKTDVDGTAVPRTFVLSLQLDENCVAFNESYNCPDRGFVIGRTYHKGVKAWFGEVIAYDRILSAREVADVEQYLKAKWIMSGSSVPALKSTLAEDASLKLASGASLNLNGQATTLSGLSSSGGTITGDVTLSDSFNFDFRDATSVTPLSIIGSLTLADGVAVNFANYSNLTAGVVTHNYLAATGTVSGDFDGDNLEDGGAFSRAKNAKTFRLYRVPDVSGSLEYLGNPTLERWSTPKQANTIMDLQSHDGKIYLGTGDWNSNLGPVPIWAYDPVGGSFTNELSSGTDAIELFRVGSDGRLYAPATDPRESAENVGSMFRKELDGSWTIFPNYSKEVLPSSSGTAQLVQHVFDAEICLSHLFMAGNGIAKSDNDGSTWSRVDNYPEGIRMNSLIRCGDEIFCKVDNAVYFSGSSDDSGTLEQSSWFPSAGKAVMLRWNETTGVFETFTNTWANIAPGLKHKDAALQLGTGSTVQNASTRFWHATPFGNRNLYVIGDNNSKRSFTSPVSVTDNVPSGTRPMMAASGYVTDDGNGGRILKADRITLPDGYWPIDFCVDGDAAYMLAFAYNSEGQNVRHGVWTTTDGVNFTQILTFDYQQVMMSIEFMDGYFYFGVAHKAAMVALGALKSGTSENAGRLYRVKWPNVSDFPDPVNGVVTVTEPGTYEGDFPYQMNKLVVNASGSVAITNSRAGYAGPVEVKSGSRLEVADYLALGAADATITVESGASLVLTTPKAASLAQTQTYFNPSIVLAGAGTDGNGALVYAPSLVSESGLPDRLFRSVKLSGDATITVDSRWGIYDLDLAGWTLTRLGSGNWMFNGTTVSRGYIDNRSGTMTWQNANSSGTADDSSITISGGSLTIWNSSSPIATPVILKGGVLTAGYGVGTSVNRLTGTLIITNELPAASTVGGKSLNFEGPVRVDATGEVTFGNTGTNVFASSFAAKDAITLKGGTYLFESSMSVPRDKDLYCFLGSDVFFDGEAERGNFGGIAVGDLSRVTLNGGSLAPRMVRTSNGGAVYGTIHNASGVLTDHPDDLAYIGEASGSLGVFVQDAAATSSFSNSVYVGNETNSYGFLCQRGGLFTHQRNGYFHLGLKGNGFLWITGGTNDSHFAKQNVTRLKMSEEDGSSTLVVKGEGTLLQTDSLIAGNTSKPTTNTISVTDGATLRAHRFYSVAGRAEGSFSCVQIDGGILAPSYFSAWGDVGNGDASFYERTFNRVTVHGGGVVFDTTGCVDNEEVETGVSYNALNFERPSGRGIKAIALPTDAAFLALEYKSPVPIVFEGPGYGATAFANFDYATGKLSGVVIGSAGCDYDDTSRAYVLAPTGNPAKYACAITLTEDNRSAGAFTKRGENVALSLYGTNDCTGVIVESGILTAAGERALPQNVPLTVKRGATLVPYAGSALVASALEGEGSVSGNQVTLADGGKIYLTADEIFAAGATPLTFAGTLTLGQNATVIVKDPENLSKFAAHASVPIVNAASMTGETPALESSELASNWRVKRSGNTLRFSAIRGAMLLLK